MAERKSNPAAPIKPQKHELKRELIVLDFHEHDMESAIADLLEMAKAGTINGLIFAARMTHTTSPYRRATKDPFLFCCSGRLVENQAEAIGAAVMLQNQLAKM